MPCLKMFHGFNHIPNETTVVEALITLVPLLPHNLPRFVYTHRAPPSSSSVWSLSWLRACNLCTSSSFHLDSSSQASKYMSQSHSFALTLHLAFSENQKIETPSSTCKAAL